jgi:hypothetical protein
MELKLPNLFETLDLFMQCYVLMKGIEILGRNGNFASSIVRVPSLREDIFMRRWN